jgi:hypothetical protein
MISIDDKLVSDLIFERKFVCDLSACKGACCVSGDAGAPLEEEEAKWLEKNLEKIKPYMSAEGIAAVQEQGTSVLDIDNELVTTLLPNRGACAYVYFDEHKTAKCAIEKAWLDGEVDFRKPISCHLYPIRVNHYKEFDAINYHEWEVCKPACKCGDKLDVKVYKFLKEPIIRKFGDSFFKQLELADSWLEKKRKTKK